MAPFTDEERAQVRELHAQGLGRNEISRRTGIHNKRVSGIAKELGLSFVRGARTAAATEAKKMDAKAKRAALALALLDDAERLRQQLWQPAEYVDHGGKEFDEARWTMPEPTFSDKRNLTQSIGVLVDRSLKLDQHDADQGSSAARSMLGDLSRALGAAAEALAGDEPPPEDG